MKKFLLTFALFLLLNACTVNVSENDKTLKSGVQTVQGTVIGGGDQTPEGLLDSPREFIYQLKLETGEEINVTYTAYPPSPTMDEVPGPQLMFHAGQINIGDTMTARGLYDVGTNTLTVAQEDHFIETME